jgi:hypothetical protein
MAIFRRHHARAYAQEWALKRNPDYPDFSQLGEGGDCANFRQSVAVRRRVSDAPRRLVGRKKLCNYRVEQGQPPAAPRFDLEMGDTVPAE